MPENEIDTEVPLDDAQEGQGAPSDEEFASWMNEPGEGRQPPPTDEEFGSWLSGKPAPEKAPSFVTELGKAAVSGVGGAGEQFGHVLKAIGAEKWGEALDQYSTEFQKKWEMSPQTRESFVKSGVAEGVQSMVPSVTAGAPGAVIGGLAAGPAGAWFGYGASAGLTMGVAEYQNYLDEYRKATGQDPDAGVKGWAALSGLAEGGFEALSDWVGGKLIFGPGVKTAGQSIKQILRRPLKQALTDFGKIQATEVGSEVLTAGAQSAVRQQTDMPTPGIGEAMAGAVIPAMTMAGLFQLGAVGLKKARLNSIESGLSDPKQDPLVRSKSVLAIDQTIRESFVDEQGKVTPEGQQTADAWLGYAIEAMKAGLPINLDQTLDPSSLQIERDLILNDPAMAQEINRVPEILTGEEAAPSPMPEVPAPGERRSQTDKAIFMREYFEKASSRLQAEGKPVDSVALIKNAENTWNEANPEPAPPAPAQAPITPQAPSPGESGDLFAPRENITAAANEAATSPTNPLKEPTEAQKVAASRTDLLPGGWKMEIGKTRTKEGHTYEAEVDWHGNRILFADKKHMENPDIVNHEIAHVVIETMPDSSVLFDDYVKAKKEAWTAKGYDPEWIVKNHFHREEIAMDYGDYLSGKDVPDPVKALFKKHLEGKPSKGDQVTKEPKKIGEQAPLSATPEAATAPQRAPSVSGESIREISKKQTAFGAEMESHPPGTTFTIGSGPNAGTWKKGKTAWSKIGGKGKGASITADKTVAKLFGRADEIRGSIKAPKAKVPAQRISTSTNPMYPVARDIRKGGGLNIDAVRRIVGTAPGGRASDELKQLLRAYPGLIRKGGQDVSVAAESYGFESDSQLIESLLDPRMMARYRRGKPVEEGGFLPEEETLNEEYTERQARDEAIEREAGYTEEEATRREAELDERIAIVQAEGATDEDIVKILEAEGYSREEIGRAVRGEIESKTGVAPTEDDVSFDIPIIPKPEEEAARLGAIFNGMQEWPKQKDGTRRDPVPVFTDSVTKSTFFVMPGETLEENLTRMRQKFGAEVSMEIPLPPPKKEDFVGKEETGELPLEQKPVKEPFELTPHGEVGRSQPPPPEQGSLFDLPGIEDIWLEPNDIWAKQENSLIDALDRLRDRELKTKVPYSAREVIAEYEKATGEAFPYGFLADQLDKAGTKVSLDDLNMHPRANGMFSRPSNLIRMRRTDRLTPIDEDRLLQFARTFGHEGIHAIVTNLRKTDRDVYDDLMDRMNEFAFTLKPHFLNAPAHIKEWLWAIDELYETRNSKLEEIITYGLTNPNVAQWLDLIPSNAKVRGENLSMWGEFKRIILAAIGKVVRTTTTKLDELAQIMDDFHVQASATSPTYVAMNDHHAYARNDLLVESARDAYAKFRNGDFSDVALKTIKPYMNQVTDLPWLEKNLSIPWLMAKNHPLWKSAFRIFGIERPEWRGELIHQHTKAAEPFFQLGKTLKEKGYTQDAIDRSRGKVNKILITGDAVLGPQLQGMMEEYRSLTPGSPKQKELADRINQRLTENRYSDEELRKGVKTDRGDIVKLNTEEIEAYKSVRNSLDGMFSSYLDHMTDQQFRNYQNQKWYAILSQVAGIDLGKGTTLGIVKSGLDQAALLRARKIQPNIKAIFERVDEAMEAAPEDFALAPTPGGLEKPTIDRVAADKLYKKISDKLFENLQLFEENLGKVLGIKGEELSTAAKELFYAYAQTRPQIKRIKSLRNEYKKQVGFFPRVRVEGKHKMKLVETLYNKEGAPIGEKQHFMAMYDNQRQGVKLYNEIMTRYAKNGKIPKNWTIVQEPSSRTPEYGFQGVNDINVQKVFDDAIQNLQVKETFFDESGKPVNIQEAIRELGYQTVARQFQARGFGKHMIHRQQDVVKGYIEGDKPYGWFGSSEGLEKVLFNYITGMSGIMSKQVAAADFLDLMKTVPKHQVEMFKALSDYGGNQLRNETKADQISNKIRSFAFTWYLGGVIRPAVIQLTQNFITGIPKHAQYLRANKLGGAGKAEKDYTQAMVDVRLKKLTDVEKKMIDQMLTQGVTIDQYIRDVYSSFGDPFSQGFKSVLKKLAIPFSSMETFNRKSAALTRFRPAYQQALKSGLSERDAYEKAFESARDFVYDTHYAMGKANLPLIAQGEGLGVAAKTLYTFRPFTHNFILQNYYDLKKGDFKTFAHTMAYVALLGGMMGLPFIKDIFEFLQSKFGLDYPRSIRQTLRSIGGKTLESFGMGGIPAMLGTNISGSLAIGVPFVGETPADTVYGVYAGMGTKAKRAAESTLSGDYARAAENLSPEFMRGPMTAARQSGIGKELFGTPGIATSPTGRPYYDEQGKPISMGPYEAGAKALGFQPTEYALQMEKEATVNRLESYFAKQKTQLGKEYRIAKINKDPDATKKLLEGVRSLNQKIKDTGNIVPLTSVSKVIESSRERPTAQKARERRYKTAE